MGKTKAQMNHQRTKCIHGDDDANPEEHDPAIAPPIAVSTTYEADNPQNLIYGRDGSPIGQRVEAILGVLEGGHAVVYASGLSAAASCFSFFQPKRVVLDWGYFGISGVLNALKIPVVVGTAANEFQAGDLIWLETPLNPTCLLQDIPALVSRAKKVGAVVVVDSTFASPVLQLPLSLGADMVMHSTTKFLGGHSDSLGGVLITPDSKIAETLRVQRHDIGNMMGSLEAWLLLRSLKTLPLRVKQQSKTACKLAHWLSTQSIVTRVWHTSLPSHPHHDLALTQMKGHPGVLSFELQTQTQAQRLPKLLRLSRECTSLGGVHSTIDWRRR